LVLLISSALLFQVSSGVPLPNEVQCGVSPYDEGTYVVGGGDARPLEFPWQISQQLLGVGDDFEHNCGGSIISDQWVLTAAHCVDPEMNPPTTMAIVTGAHQLSIKNGTEERFIINENDVFMHPRWDPYVTKNYDYALIKLPTKLDFSGKHSHLGPICLANVSDAKTFDQMTCVVSGWGSTVEFGPGADILQKVDVKVWTHPECFASWIKGGIGNGGLRVKDQMICITGSQGEGHGPCHGDSGGPLQCRVKGRYTLAGSTSFGRYCGAADPPGVFARVSAERAWIDRIMKQK